MLQLRKFDIGDDLVLKLMNAFFKVKAGWESQIGFMNMMTRTLIQNGQVTCDLVEFQDYADAWVVASTSVAELATMSATLEEQLYLHLLNDGTTFGEPKLWKDW